ncbi:MAG: 3-deoxy-manno-octulosonate cytidylyltransferase [Magnetococcales bacterium]|nr:3-deoxy-manno-octulosonate cytidylyltransferase [Magnetococcales bacterium]NGZ06989.1 3-deoxy-manno-octulosonate cytidylyltransferase [Magnetococcales bacterium]
MGHRFAVVIPARFGSTRLPGKPLLDLGGRPMIQWVYAAASRSSAHTVVVATDDERICAAVHAFGGRAVMTSADHASGTDRVAEVARLLPEPVIVNVQGDEPFLDPGLIDLVAAPLLRDPTVFMSTLAHPLMDPAEWFNPNVVKVVCDRSGRALYFSRAPVPWDRDCLSAGDGHALARVEGVLRHVGVYGYRSDFLSRFASLEPTPLERLERLEQLRVLEHGYGIQVMVTPDPVAGGVDALEDLERARARVLNEEG